MIIEEIKIETNETTRSVKELRQELKDLKNQLLNTQQGTEEYNKALQQAANIQKELKEQMFEVNNSAQDFGQTLGNVTGIMAGVSGAITAATGALSLFGIENEEAQKKITATMTALIGVTQGLSKIDSGVKAFKRLTAAIQLATGATSKFSAALLGSGIGVFVAGLLYMGKELVSIFSKVTKDMIDAKNALQGTVDFQTQVEEAAKVIEEANVGITNEQRQQLRLMDAQGTSAKAILEAELLMYETNLNDLQVEMDKTKQLKAQAEAEKARLIAAKQRAADEVTGNPYAESGVYLSTTLGQYDKYIAEQEAAITALNKALSDGSGKVKEYEGEIAILMARLANLSKTSKGVGNTTQDAIEREMNAIERRLQAFEDSKKTELQLLEERYQREQILFEGNEVILTKLTEEYEAERARIIAEAEEERNRPELEAQQSRLKLLERFNDELMTEKEHLDARYNMLIDAAEKEGQDTTKIKEWYEKEKTRITKEEEEKQTAIRKAAFKTYGDIANGVGDILMSMSEMMEEGSEEQKGLAIAATTIQMLVGIATAMSGAFTTKSGPWDIALAAVQAAAIAASGIASIVKINQVKADGSNGGSASVPTINIASAVAASPDFTQSVDGALTQTAIQDQKVYVTEHDITDTQKKVEVTQAMATY